MGHSYSTLYIQQSTKEVVMDDKVTKIFQLISEHLSCNIKGYDSTKTDYFFGRLCSSEELFRDVSEIVNGED